MNAIAFADARRRLEEVFEQALDHPVYITRAGRSTLVLIDADELARMLAGCGQSPASPDGFGVERC